MIENLDPACGAVQVKRPRALSPAGSEQPSEERGEPRYGLIDIFLTLALVSIVLAATVPSVVGTLRAVERNGAARHVLAEIRATQSLAVVRGGVFGFQWGADTGVNLPASQYRIVRDATGTCSFPAVNAPADDTTVIRAWSDLHTEYSGMTIQSIRDNNNQALGGVMFNSMGASVNTCTPVSFPIEVTVSDLSGATLVIEIRSAGGTHLQ